MPRSFPSAVYYECQDCRDEEEAAGRKSLWRLQARARRHAKRGHRVRLEVALVTLYGNWPERSI